MEFINSEILECARYGEDEDLAEHLRNGGDVNHRDNNGNTALHKDWAVQNQQLDVLNFLLRNYDVDVLKKNDAGRSSLTDAFDCGNTEVLAACLSHPSSSEENLLKIDQNILDASNNETVVHEFDFSTSTSSPSKTLLVRELPITRADNPFGSTDTPEDDTTGLGIWPASIIMARWAVHQASLFKGKVVIELGAGCGVPGLAIAKYCAPSKVYITDIHGPTLDNLVHNVHTNNMRTPNVDAKSDADGNQDDAGMEVDNEVKMDRGRDIELSCVDAAATTLAQVSFSNNAESVTNKESSADTVVDIKLLNWKDVSSYPEESVDIVVGADLIYDKDILSIFIFALNRLLTPVGLFFYVAPDNARDGMEEFCDVLQREGISCVGRRACPAEFFDNPLSSKDSDQYVLHFYDLSAQRPHTLYTFRKM